MVAPDALNQEAGNALEGEIGRVISDACHKSMGFVIMLHKAVVHYNKCDLSCWCLVFSMVISKHLYRC